MKFPKSTKTNLLILVGALVLIILYSLSSTSIIPYSRTKLNMYTYEGYENNEATPTPTPENLPSSAPTVPPNPTTSVPTATSNADSNKPKKTEGFEGLQGSALAAQSSSIDYFSTLPAGNQCELGPYSNSKGYICLDENAKRMLSTRGGNAQGALQ
jgi:hypothetical protein